MLSREEIAMLRPTYDQDTPISARTIRALCDQAEAAIDLRDACLLMDQLERVVYDEAAAEFRNHDRKGEKLAMERRSLKEKIRAALAKWEATP